MKAKTFENLIRKIVREEIDYALRREIKSLKEDLRDEITPIIKEQHTFKKQNFVKDNTLNELLNETAQGDTNTQTAMAPVNDPFSTSGVVPTEAMPAKIANVVNRDYRSLMKAIDKKKGK
jgi:hypothetical protein